MWLVSEMAAYQVSKQNRVKFIPVRFPTAEVIYFKFHNYLWGKTGQLIISFLIYMIF